MRPKNKLITLRFIILLFFIIEKTRNQYSKTKGENDNESVIGINHSPNMIHFIKCGEADSILIESNGKYGLVDSSNPYKFIENEVEHVQIDESLGENNQWSSSPDESVQAVLNYLDYLKIDKLDFIIGTHSHSDHIGGIPAIAYKYVDSNTKYYYRQYRETIEDICKIKWANYKYYLATVHSMQKKGAELIDVTNIIINFNFGDFHIELLNTDIDPDELNLGENQNSIVILVKYKNTKVFLASDMIIKDDKAIKDYLGKIDILKLAHHGFSETSCEFLLRTKPDYVVISNTHIHDYSLINYMKDNFNPKIYLTQNVPGTSENVELSAIKLQFLVGEKEFLFSNTGNEIEKNELYGSSWYGIDKEFEKCEENITDQIFIVSGIGNNIMPCLSIPGSYVFNIEGKFSKEANRLNKVNIKLKTSTGNIIKSVCTPFNKFGDFSNDFLQCEIDICMYPLEGIDIYLPIIAPQEKGYTIKKWKNIFGIDPDESNKINSVTCLPIIENTFIPSSIEAKGCSGKKSQFLIYGEWEDKDESKIPSLLDFSLVIPNNSNIAECDYITTSPIHMECTINGEGEITIKEQNFNGYFASFKMKKLDSSIKTEKCNVDTTGSKGNYSKNSYLCLRIGFILLMVLLILI